VRCARSRPDSCGGAAHLIRGRRDPHQAGAELGIDAGRAAREVHRQAAAWIELADALAPFRACTKAKTLIGEKLLIGRRVRHLCDVERRERIGDASLLIGLIARAFERRRGGKITVAEECGLGRPAHAFQPGNARTAPRFDAILRRDHERDRSSDGRRDHGGADRPVRHAAFGDRVGLRGKRGGLRIGACAIAAIPRRDQQRELMRFRYRGCERRGLERIRGEIIERQATVKVRIVAEPQCIGDRADVGRAPRDDQLRAVLPGSDAQHAEDERTLGGGWRRENIAVDSADRSGRRHHGDRAAVGLVVGGDDDPVRSKN
jgi:hypothetical protein